MAKLYQSPVCLAVLNPKGRDPFVDYGEGVLPYDAKVHAPVSFHSYAAATFGTFCNSVDQVIQRRNSIDAVLVLIRRRTWITLDAVKKLQKKKIKVVVAWKECGYTQVTQQLSSLRALRAYQKILEIADGVLSPTLGMPPRGGKVDYEEFWRKLKFIPTPYPLEYPDWDFSRPSEEKKGIMLGTREFKTLARNHLNAVSWAANLAHEINVSWVTIVNSEGARGKKILQELTAPFPVNCLRIIEKPLPYVDYMDMLASHRLVFQMDRSGVPGQVAGDCLLARTLCAGGNSTIEQVAFPALSDDGSLRPKVVFEEIRLLLQDEKIYAAEVENSQKIAKKQLSFQAVANQFGEWLPAL